MRADVMVDASGRNTMFPDWLQRRGHGCDAKRKAPAAFSISRGTMRLRDGQEEPPRDGTPGGGDMGYIKFGIFPADNRHFSVTLGGAGDRNAICAWRW